MYCTKCGNKVKNSDNFCIKCGNPVNKTKVIEGNGIKATLIVRSCLDEKDHVETEDEVIEVIIDDLDIDRSLFKIEKRSDDYSTLLYNDDVLFRLKYTQKAQWIKIPSYPSIRKEYMNNPLFEAQKNKNQFFWKSKIKSIFDYKETLLKVIDEIDAQKKN